MHSWRLAFSSQYEQFISALNGIDGDALIVLFGTDLAAYLLYRVQKTPNGSDVTIVAFKVALEYRRRGIGRTLLRALLRRAKELGWQRAIVQVGAGLGSAAARNLYEGEGFQVTSFVMESVVQADASTGSYAPRRAA